MEHQLYRVLALNDFGAFLCYTSRQHTFGHKCVTTNQTLAIHE